MKQSIEWHKNCLKNTKSSLESEKAVLKRQEESVNRLENVVKMREYQIEQAIKHKKDGFDSEKYLRIKNSQSRPSKRRVSENHSKDGQDTICDKCGHANNIHINIDEGFRCHGLNYDDTIKDSVQCECRLNEEHLPKK